MNPVYFFYKLQNIVNVFADYFTFKCLDSSLYLLHYRHNDCHCHVLSPVSKNESFKVLTALSLDNDFL